MGLALPPPCYASFQHAGRGAELAWKGSCVPSTCSVEGGSWAGIDSLFGKAGMLAGSTQDGDQGELLSSGSERGESRGAPPSGFQKSVWAAEAGGRRGLGEARHTSSSADTVMTCWCRCWQSSWGMCAAHEKEATSCRGKHWGRLALKVEGSKLASVRRVGIRRHSALSQSWPWESPDVLACRERRRLGRGGGGGMWPLAAFRQPLSRASGGGFLCPVWRCHLRGDLQCAKRRA